MDDKTDQGSSHIWVSREEYERLKSTQSVVPEGVIASGPDSSELKHSGKISPGMWIMLACALLSFVFPPLTLLFLLTGAISWYVARPRSSADEHKAKGEIVAKRLLTAGAVIISLGMIFPPFGIFLFIILWQLGCWTGIGSCQTA